MTFHRASVIVIAAGLTIAGIVLWSVTRPQGADDAAAEVTRPMQSPGDSPAAQTATRRIEAASPTPLQESPDLAYHCAALSDLMDSGDPGVGWPESHDVSDDCTAALDRRFLDAPVSNTMLPASSAPSWRQVFSGFPAKAETVWAAVQNENCDVPDGGIRPHLASDCAARAMAEVAVFAGACGVAHSEQWIDGTGLPRGVPRDNIYGHYLSRVLPGHLRTPVDALASASSDQDSYWRDRERLEELYLRTAWTKYKCDSLRSTALAMFDATTLDHDTLMARAAKLGDGFALAHHAGPPPHVDALMDINPVQAFIHLARTEARDVQGTDQHRFELRVGPDGRINAARFHVSPEVWRSKKETESAKYVLAAKLLADATNVEIDQKLLHRITDPTDPSYATAADLYEARLQAEELVADAIARIR